MAVRENIQSLFSQVSHTVSSWIDDLIMAKANRIASMRIQGLETHQGIQHNPDPNVDMLAERKNSSVAAAIARVSDAVMRVPLKVYEVTIEDGAKRYEADDDHPANAFLEEPNQFNDIGEIIEHFTQSLMLTGNAFMSQDEFKDGIPTEFYPLETHRTYLVPNSSGMPDHYVYQIDSRDKTPFDLTEMCHARIYNVNDPFYGRSRIEPIHTELLSTHYAKLFNKTFFKNDATPGGMIIPKDMKLNDKQIKQLNKSWNKQFKGPQNKHKVGALPFPAEFQPFSPPLKDMAFLDLLKMDREQMLMVLGTPPALVGIYEYANYSNSEIQKTLFWENAGIPMVVRIERALNRQIMWRWWDRGHVFMFDTSGIEALQGDLKTKAQVDVLMTNGRNPIMSVNEVRKRRGLDEVEWGNEPNVQLGLNQSENAIAEGDDSGKNEKTATRSIRKKLSPQQTHLKATEKFVSEREIRFSKIVSKFFVEQGKRVINSVEEYTGNGAAMSRLDLAIRAMARQMKNDPDAPDDAIKIFDMTAEDAALAGVSNTFTRKTIYDSADEAIHSFGLDLQFDVNNSQVSVAVDSFFNRIRKINDTSYAKIQALLKDAYDGGWTSAETTKQIRRMFKDFSKVRASRIARTEIHGVVEGGTNLAYIQSDEIDQIEWVATQDANTRDTHIHLNGERVAIGQLFSNGLKHPGDPNGPASETIHCRCTNVPVLKGN